MVTVKVSGDLDVKSIAIDPEAVDPEDVELLQDMVLAAVNEGAARGAGAGLEEARRRHRRPRRAGRRARAAGLLGRRPVELLPTRPAARHRAGQAAGHRRSHGAAARVPPAARLEEDALALADAIREVKERIGLCEICFNLADGPRCRICADERRDPAAVCVVEEPSRHHPRRAHARVPRPLPRARRRALADRRRRPGGPADRRAARARGRHARARERRRPPRGHPRGRARDQPDDDRRGDRTPHRRAAARALAGRDASRGWQAACRSGRTWSTRTS